MLDQLKQIAIFARTVDHGSFRGAARALNISPSVISHHVAQLEESLGTALLYRSTRKLSVTDAGRRLITHAREMLDAAETGLNAIADHGQQLSGELNVTAPAVLAQSAFVDYVASFSRTHPLVRLDLDFSDSRRSVIEGGIDVAIRMGWLKDSTLKARKLFDVQRMLIAAAQYVQDRPIPKHPLDLQGWDWLALSPVSIKQRFQQEGHRSVTLKPASRLRVNDAYALYRLASAGAGLATVPDFLCETDVSNGSVQHVLPQWQLDPVGVFAVWPPNAPKSGLTARFVEALVAFNARRMLR